MLFSPKRGRDKLQPFLSFRTNFAVQLSSLFYLDALHTSVSSHYQAQLYQHNNLLPRNDFPNISFVSNSYIYLIFVSLIFLLMLQHNPIFASVGSASLHDIFGGIITKRCTWSICTFNSTISHFF